MFSTFRFTTPTIFDGRPDHGLLVSYLYCSRLRLHFVTHRSPLHSCLATSFTLNPASNTAKAWALLFTVLTLVQDVWFFTELSILFYDVIDIYICLNHSMTPPESAQRGG